LHVLKIPIGRAFWDCGNRRGSEENVDGMDHAIGKKSKAGEGGEKVRRNVQ
jgi:hypothetical protein